MGSVNYVHMRTLLSFAGLSSRSFKAESSHSHQMKSRLNPRAREFFPHQSMLNPLAREFYPHQSIRTSSATQSPTNLFFYQQRITEQPNPYLHTFVRGYPFHPAHYCQISPPYPSPLPLNVEGAPRAHPLGPTHWVPEAKTKCLYQGGGDLDGDNKGLMHRSGRGRLRFRRWGGTGRERAHDQFWRRRKRSSKNNQMWSAKACGTTGGGDHVDGDNQRNNSSILTASFSNNENPLEGASNISTKTRQQRRHALMPVQSDGQCTTAMIRNIPNRYTRKMLIDFLDQHCMTQNQKKEDCKSCGSEEERVSSAFDFVYLPIDFERGLNKGYAFVNFTNPGAVWKFFCVCNNQSWSHFRSKKRLEIVNARIQGKEELLRRLEEIVYPCEEYAALCFSPSRDGSSGDDGSVKTIIVGRCVQ